jgi:hypothetical protein
MEIVALGMETRKVGRVYVIAALILALEDQLDFLDPVCHEAGAYRPLSAFA